MKGVILLGADPKTSEETYEGGLNSRYEESSGTF